MLVPNIPPHPPSPLPKVIHITTIDMSLRYLLLNQMQAIQAAGYEVVGVSAAGPHVPTIEAAGIRHIHTPLTRTFSPLADLRALWHLYRVLRREKPTIVHTHTPKPGLLGQLAARMAGVPVVINTLHGFYFHEHTPPRARRFYIGMEKIAALCSDVILSQNGEDVETAVREHICPPQRIKRLGNGIDVCRFDPATITAATRAAKQHELGIDPHRPVVGFVGRLVAEKGLLELFQAMQTVIAQRPDVQLLIIGPEEPDKADGLNRATAAHYGLAQHAIFAGHRNDMAELYALMDIFALPSHREGFPRSPMEACAMGVPSIVTDIRGCREVVEHGRNGLLVPVKDAAALAQALLTLLNDTALSSQLRQNCRTMALENFDERRVFEMVVGEYGRLLSDKINS